MKKSRLLLIVIPAVLLALFLLVLKAADTLPWPESPLYTAPSPQEFQALPVDRTAVMKLISGHYAHYDIVSYEDVTTRVPMRTFIVSYGFTDFFVSNGKLYQSDRFVRAEQILNQKNTTSYFSEKAAGAITPRITEVELTYSNQGWTIYRPATPVLLGINGNPELPLSKDPKDTNLTDPDEDGFPGVTVVLDIGGFLKGSIYITRREIFMDHIRVYSPDLMWGHVEDHSEQFVIGASLWFLNRTSHNRQHPDPGMNPLILKRVAPEIDTWEELKAIRDELFPPVPAFH